MYYAERAICIKSIKRNECRGHSPYFCCKSYEFFFLLLRLILEVAVLRFEHLFQAYSKIQFLATYQIHKIMKITMEVLLFHSLSSLQVFVTFAFVREPEQPQQKLQ